ncbi:MAG: sugar phosphate isomerase/epimerase [Lentisphaeria bacterium]|nr:sugar phosphate isomerase/epimerase [Lentisphaeria bacterium]
MIKHSQLAAQLYTLRDFLKTPEDVEKSLAKVKAIGYEAIQLSGIAPMDDQVLADIIRASGLFPCASHDPAVKIFDDPDAVIARLKLIGCPHTAYPCPHLQDLNTVEAVTAWAEVLEKAAQKFQAAGVTLSYHNHAREFCKIDGEIQLEMLYRLAPSLLAEIDTFWVQSGGQNPIDWINKFPGRQKLLHLKDYGIINNERCMRPIGCGNLNWDGIFEAAEKAGVEYYIVEQDVCQKDPFESLADSYRFIVDRFVK